ncbi:MAG: DUF86 domain-containing protein [Acidobacteriota bacterium]
MVDTEVVARHLSNLDDCLQALDGERPVSVEAMQSDRKTRDLVLYELQRAIQNVLDLGSHLLADRGEAVSEYSEIFTSLARAGDIPDDLAARVRGLAGFRNVIIHDYVDVDLDRVVGFVNDRLDDLRELARHMHRATQGDEEPE